MSLKKVVGLLAGFALAVGLIGAGVGAQFTDQVTAKENISVGTFQCKIIQPSSGTIAADGKSVEYTAPPITSSLPGSAPFSFTVENTGSIPQVLTVSSSAVSAPFSAMLAPVAPAALAAGGTQLYNAGLQWGELDNSWLGKSGSITYTVNCNEGAAISVAVTGPVKGDAGSPLDGQNVLKLTTTGVGFANGPAIVLSYDASSFIPGETYTDAETAFGHSDPTTSSFSVYFEENCSTGANGVPPIGKDGPFTITATQGSTVATFTGTLPCSLVTNP